MSTFNADRFTDATMYDWVRDNSVANKLPCRAHALSARLGKITVTLKDCACGACPPVARPRAAPNPPLLSRSHAQAPLLSYKHLLTKLSEGKRRCNVRTTTPNRRRTREPEPTTQLTTTRETIETRRAWTRYAVH